MIIIKLIVTVIFFWFSALSELHSDWEDSPDAIKRILFALRKKLEIPLLILYLLFFFSVPNQFE